jgi:hypothetical protein
MRRLIAAASALLIAACSPPAPPAAEPAADPPAAPSESNAAELAGPLAAGQWSFRADESVFAAGFGAPESEYQLVVTCNAGSGAVSIMSAHELAPDQPTTLTLITATRTVSVAAASFNEGLPSVNAELARSDAQDAIAALSQPQERIGVAVNGEAHLYPWDQALARALQNCR